MSFSSAPLGRRPSATASPPQNGSTSRRCRVRLPRAARRCGTCQRLPPAHFSGRHQGQELPHRVARASGRKCTASGCKLSRPIEISRGGTHERAHPSADS